MPLTAFEGIKKDSLRNKKKKKKNCEVEMLSGRL